MTHSEHAPSDKPEPDPDKSGAERIYVPTRTGWLQRRREKVIEEIEKNRRGDYKVPTWVLAVALVVVIGVWGALIFFA